MSFDKTILKTFTEKNGVYLMKNDKGDVLYIGKAKNLKKRICQYFSGHEKRALVGIMIPQITDIETIVVESEKEALILENNLIKKLQPKYNLLLKDDKTFICLELSRHKWPALRPVRLKKQKDNTTYFGPYTNARAAKESLDLILKLFPLRQCSDNELQNRSRPCVLYEIKKCLAPCVGKCTEEEYQRNVTQIVKFLHGEDKIVLKELKSEMEKASKNLEFEKAATFLERIKRIEHVLSLQHVDQLSKKDHDVIGLYGEGANWTISLLQYREGKLLNAQHFSFSSILEEEILRSFLLQHYLSKEITCDILLPPLKEKKIVEEILSERAGKKIRLKTGRTKEDKALLEIAKNNAQANLEREKRDFSLNEKLLLELKERLLLTRYPQKIACFDTSNLCSEDAVAAMVFFVNGKRDKSRTRLFKIKTLKKGDVPALGHVLNRYLKRTKEENENPDLIILDGGKGQLGEALKVFDVLNIASIDVIAISKEDSRHDKGLSKEKIHLPYQRDPLIIDPTSPHLFLLQKIRDEAHQTAIAFHRKTRSKRILNPEKPSMTNKDAT